MNLKTAYTVILMGLLQACGNRQAQEHENKALKEEMQSRQITRVTPGQITDKALQLGNEISASAEAAWFQQLKPVLAKEDVSEALAACAIDSLPLIQQLRNEYGASIKKVSLQPIDADNLATSLEAELADAYQYNVENNLPLTGNVQDSGKEEVLYTRAILFSDPGCLQCHGSAESSNNKTKAAIVSRYASSPAALKSKQGQLAGIWSIHLPTKEIVKQLAK